MLKRAITASRRLLEEKRRKATTPHSFHLPPSRPFTSRSFPSPASAAAANRRRRSVAAVDWALTAWWARLRCGKRHWSTQGGLALVDAGWALLFRRNGEKRRWNLDENVVHWQGVRAGGAWAQRALQRVRQQNCPQKAQDASYRLAQLVPAVGQQTTTMNYPPPLPQSSFHCSASFAVQQGCLLAKTPPVGGVVRP